MVHFHPLCYAHFDPLRVVHFNPPQVVYYVRFLQLMKEETKIDKDYLIAFNLGYELAKELNLKSPVFKDLDSANDLINAKQDGITQYINEVNLGRGKEVNQSVGHNNIASKEEDGKGKNRGFDLTI